MRLLYWQAPTILNPHLATGTKDQEASRIVYEPLWSVNPDGERIPILAAEIPSLENGGRAPDGTWTIWRLKQGVVWHDGTPFTADDVIFTWEYISDPATAATHFARIQEVSRHPTSLARSHYWLGRTAEASQRSDQARAEYDKIKEETTNVDGR